MNRYVLAAIALCFASCSRSKEAPAEMAAESKEEAASFGAAGSGPGGGGRGAPAPAAPPAQMARSNKSKADVDDAKSGAFERDEGGTVALAMVAADGESAPAEPEVATRSWFPESFLFEPRVVTDASGRASFEVKVPDRLTTWRVLALAHTRSGEQAGVVTKFLGTLPVYVEPVVPRQLVAGDVVRIPVQLVNTTEKAVARALRISIEGGVLEGPPSRSVSVPAGGSAVEQVTVRAPRSGTLTLSAELVGVDAIRRTIAVVPRGKKVVVERSGTLGGARTLSIEAPAGEPSEARLTVFPGALAILRSELATAGDRGGAAEVAFALLLAGEAPGLLSKLGGEVDAEALRTLRVIATQRALRHARTPSLETSTLLAEAALAHPDAPVVARLGERLTAQLASFQRPDGTYGGATGWTLQRLLVGTAESVHALSAAASRGSQEKARAEAARIRASAAVERNLGRIEDPYTAAMLVASGAASGSVADQLRAKITAALVTSESDGTRSLALPAGVVRADGAIPTAAEIAAVAVLALGADPAAKDAAGDLSATVLAGYQPGYGFGDGRASLWCLRAVLATFTAPLPPSVRIALDVDGAEVSSGAFDAKQLKDMLTLSGPIPPGAGARKWTVRGEPRVPGLGFRLSLVTWVPWAPEPEAGLALEIRAPKEPRVGRAAEITLVAAAPDGYTGELVHRLPAGVVPDVPSLEALVAAGKINAFDTEDGAVRMQLVPFEAATPLQLSYRVVPTLGGTLSSGASTLALGGETRTAPPATWIIR